ncbi:unnamed protein product [Nezara viridula]|uniref:Uncharacterized protein n=1 Tax=Nezara viridula TaxID=85310 RepID=A0A9P0H0A1_NEZVI|nr:unnamed protein product [Nezara viridula]
MRPVIDRRKRDMRRFWLYSLYAWSVPSLLTAASIAADHTNTVPVWLRPLIGTENKSCHKGEWKRRGKEEVTKLVVAEPLRV